MPGNTCSDYSAKNLNIKRNKKPRGKTSILDFSLQSSRDPKFSKGLKYV